MVKTYNAVPRYTPYLINRLNNLGFNDGTIANVKRFLRTKELPANTNYSKFVLKFKGFYIDGDKLLYKPPLTKVHRPSYLPAETEKEEIQPLEVIPDGDREEVMKELYDDFTSGVGVGIVAFYHKITQKYINITRVQVAEFLKRQAYYQITRPLIHKTNKPILTSQPQERWAIDLVDMDRYSGSNKNFRYIMTCVDMFSRYVWAVPLKLKASVDVVKGLDKIVEKADGVYPHILQKDNGGGFPGATNRGVKKNE